MKFKFVKNFPIRYKIFFGMMFLSIFCLCLLASINFYQNIQLSKKIQRYQVSLKEDNIIESLSYLVNNDTITNQNIKQVLKDNVLRLANTYNTPIFVYDLDGYLIANSKHDDVIIINDSIITSLAQNNKRFLHSKDLSDINVLYESYDYLYLNGQPSFIVKIAPVLDKTLITNELKNILKQYLFMVILLTVLSGLIAWIISKGIIKKIVDVADKMKHANMVSNNQLIVYSAQDELSPLITSYNDMMLELREQIMLLTKVEREEAWREMAKQVAHEINNPLTPLLLTVQNFENKFNSKDPDIDVKVKSFSESIKHQIDVISTISKAFSDFAKMPMQNNDRVEIVKTLKQSLDIFPIEIVTFTTEVDNIYFTIDKIYFTRAITNIVTNAIQAITNKEEKRVEVHLRVEEEYFIISIKDNGNGIPEALQNQVFKPRFTTKTNGMGLGLAMVKKTIEDYNGEIWFETTENVGTTFYLKFCLT